MFRNSFQRGDTKLGCIIWLVILAIAVLIAVKMVPVKIKSAQLYDFMVEQANFAANSKPETIKKRILRAARDLDLPLSEKQVKVEITGNRSRIRMQATYTVEVEFPGYTYVWDFDHVVDRPIYIF